MKEKASCKLNLRMMKATGRTSKRSSLEKARTKKEKGYFFHSDEDFREDWDWGKAKVIASKAVSKPVNKFEI